VVTVEAALPPSDAALPLVSVQRWLTPGVPSQVLDRWAADVVPATCTAKNLHNIMKMLRDCNVDPELDIAEVHAVDLAGTPYLRLKWREGRGWQRATRMDMHKEAQILQGGHGTTSIGIMGILTERRIKKMEFAGVYGLVTEHVEREWLLHVMKKIAIEGKKNWAGVLVELNLRGRWERNAAGGIPADEATVRRGLASHQGKSGHGRWCLPEDLLNFVGIWVPLTGYCLDDLPGFQNDLW
jgi:hypothetical protein